MKNSPELQLLANSIAQLVMTITGIIDERMKAATHHGVNADIRSTHGEVPPSDPFLTSQQLADHLQVSLSTVRHWMRSGKIPSIRLPGRLVRFKLSDVEEALKRKHTYHSR